MFERCFGHLEGTAAVRRPASGDLSQPCFYSPVRNGVPFDPKSLDYLTVFIGSSPPSCSSEASSIFNMTRLIFQSVSQHPAGVQRWTFITTTTTKTLEFKAHVVTTGQVLPETHS